MLVNRGETKISSEKRKNYFVVQVFAAALTDGSFFPENLSCEEKRANILNGNKDETMR